MMNDETRGWIVAMFIMFSIVSLIGGVFRGGYGFGCRCEREVAVKAGAARYYVEPGTSEMKFEYVASSKN